VQRLLNEMEIAGTRFHVKELTIEEIRLWLLRMERAVSSSPLRRPTLLTRLLVRLGVIDPLPAAAQDVVALTLFDDLTLLDVASLTTLTPEQIEKLTPSEVREVWQACREVNSDFFLMRRRLELIGQINQQAHGATLNGPLPA
jgi:hypothetical protein